MVAYEEPVAYRRIAADLRAQIATGELAPGDEVPSERALAERYGVVRMTARQALLALERAALLVPGSPRRVARHEPLSVHVTRSADRLSPGESPTAGADSWLSDMIAAGQEPEQDIRVTISTASIDVAQHLAITPGDPVIGRSLLRQTGGAAHNLITFWYPEHIAESTPLARPESVTEGSVAWLEKKFGKLRHKVAVSARMPLPTEEADLHIPGGIPVLILWRTSWTAARPLVASVAVYPADRTILEMEHLEL